MHDLRHLQKPRWYNGLCGSVGVRKGKPVKVGNETQFTLLGWTPSEPQAPFSGILGSARGQAVVCPGNESLDKDSLGK
jgi:hypothetical protein